MSECFGNWLFTDEKSKKPTTNSSFCIEIVNGVTIKKSVLGFVRDEVVDLTSYNDTAQMIETLVNAGIRSPVVYLKHWAKRGDQSKIQTNIIPESSLGGKKQFKNMLDSLNKSKADIYLDFNLNNIYRKGQGFNRLSNVAYSLQKSPASIYNYDISTKKAIVSKPKFLLKLEKVAEAIKQLSTNIENYNFTGIGNDSLGTCVYSDFDDESKKRDSADKHLSDLLSSTQSIKGKQLLSATNDYGAPYANIITNTPFYSSKYLMQTVEVPFYQMALHPYVVMFSPDINKASNKNNALLKALESGVGLKYRFTKNNDKGVGESEISDLNGTLFDDGVQDAINSWKEVSDILDKVSMKKVLSHKVVTEDVRETVFEQGIKIIVNYGEKQYKTDEYTVNAQDYKVLKSN